MNIKLVEKYLQFKKNIIVSGESLSGKTSKVMYPLVDNLISNNSNILIVDPKDEYKNKYEEILKSKNYNLIYIDFNNNESINKFNILTIPSIHFKNDEKTLCIQELRRISEILIRDTYNKDYTYARNSFIGLILYLFSSGNLDINLLDIKKIVSKAGSETLDSILSSAKSDEELALYLENLYDDDLKYKICILINNILTSYAINPNIANMINDTNISLDKAPFAIIINADNNSKYITDIINIYINQLYYQAKFQNISLNIVLENYLDKNMNINLETMMLFSISNNIKFIISTNNLDEFTNIHGKFVLKTSDIIKLSNDSIEIIEDSEQNSYNKEFTFFNVDLCLKEAINDNIARDYVDFSRFNVFDEKPTLESTNIDLLLQKINDKIDNIPEEEIEKPTLKETIEIEENDLEEDTSNPYNKIDFESELNLEKNKEPIDETVENIFDEFKIDSIEPTSNEPIVNNNIDIENIELDSNFEDLLNLIDQKILELDDTALINTEEIKEKADIMDFMINE